MDRYLVTLAPHVQMSVGEMERLVMRLQDPNMRVLIVPDGITITLLPSSAPPDGPPPQVVVEQGGRAIDLG